MIKAALFDVYGTCVDWRSGVANVARPMLLERAYDISLAEKIADHWRALYDPYMEPVRSGTQPYRPLDEIQRDNLNVVLEQVGLDAAFDDDARALLNTAWDHLPAWPDTRAALEKLKSVMPIAACSNGSVAMMQRLATHNEFAWSMICGADMACTYKPVHAVYQRSAEALGATPAETIMIACHADDLDEAKKAGLKTGYFPRPLEYGHANAVVEPHPERFDFYSTTMTGLIDSLCAAA